MLRDKCPTRWNDGSITADGPPSDTSPEMETNTHFFDMANEHCVDITFKKNDRKVKFELFQQLSTIDTDS